MLNGAGKMSKVGVLALQGAVAEHIHCLQKIDGVQVVEVRKAEHLLDIDALILPGGESTTIGKLLREYGMIEPLRDLIQAGLPVWGTCAGMILLARDIVNEDEVYLDVLDVSVRRNAYGSQLDSFQSSAVIPGVAEHDIPLTFIRAPYIEKCGPEAEILLVLDGNIVAVEHNNILATSFHPELTEDLTFHKYFIKKIS
ncbi:pyridoxine biosynthesis glutamine amidotransferase, glutaminase subunit [hydrocarbon metagenome]|uniref:glutaminase n=1 Tax=hydrocarbon metagenome TaxID=938273 RepID=A0A0W8E7C2_9ZZZZ